MYFMTFYPKGKRWESKRHEKKYHIYQLLKAFAGQYLENNTEPDSIEGPKTWKEVIKVVTIDKINLTIG